jgi:hypothetical protein
MGPYFCLRKVLKASTIPSVDVCLPLTGSCMLVIVRFSRCVSVFVRWKRDNRSSRKVSWLCISIVPRVSLALYFLTSLLSKVSVLPSVPPGGRGAVECHINMPDKNFPCLCFPVISPSIHIERVGVISSYLPSPTTSICPGSISAAVHIAPTAAVVYNERVYSAGV